MAATIRDVALAAGVSQATVSRALSMPDLVRPATRARVEAVARELGYRPNRAARGLITGRTGNLGLIVPDLANPFFAAVVKGVQAAARAADHSVFIADTDEEPGVEADLLRALAKQVDGLILCSPRAPDDELAAVDSDTTVVLMNRMAGDRPSVTGADGLSGTWPAGTSVVPGFSGAPQPASSRIAPIPPAMSALRHCTVIGWFPSSGARPRWCRAR